MDWLGAALATSKALALSPRPLVCLNEVQLKRRSGRKESRLRAGASMTWSPLSALTLAL